MADSWQITDLESNEEAAALALLIRETDSSVLAFAIYRSVADREAGVHYIKERTGCPIHEFVLSKSQPDPVALLRSLPTDKRMCVFFYDVEEALPEVAGYLNLQREAFAALPHLVVFWVRQYGLREIAGKAPDFWAWRSGVFDFRSEDSGVPASTMSSALSDGIEFTDRGDMERRISLYEGLLREYQAQPEPDERFIAGVQTRLGGLLVGLGRLKEVEPLLRRALEIREKALGPEHPDTAQSLNNLAALYYDQGRHDEAEPLYKRALEIRERALGPEHPDTGTSLNNLAELYRNQARYDGAEPLYERALEIREKTLGSEHPNTAISLNNLALLFNNQGRYDEAEPLFKRALEIAEKALGPEHPNTASSLNNLAVLYETQGRYDEAEPLYKRALEICEKALGPEHPDTAGSLNNLAGLYRNQGRYDEAEPLYKRALEICEKALGPKHPHTVLMRKNYESLLQQTKGNRR